MFEKIAHGVASNEALSRGAWTWVGVFALPCAQVAVAFGITDLIRMTQKGSALQTGRNAAHAEFLARQPEQMVKPERAMAIR